MTLWRGSRVPGSSYSSSGTYARPAVTRHVSQFHGNTVMSLQQSPVMSHSSMVIQ